jgi:peptidoglycan-associated lipoprotein
MKQTQIVKLLLLTPFLIASVTGCKTNHYGVTQLPKSGSGSAIAQDKSGLSDGGTLTPSDGASAAGKVESKDGLFPVNDRNSHEGWAANSSALQQYTVHFDYDSSSLKPDEKPKIEAVAAQLKNNPTVALKVQGHCDERGTEEYNRSLGERRALAVREELIRMGIEPTRVDTASFGNDMPIATGHTEAAFKQNRRGEFVELTPPN